MKKSAVLTGVLALAAVLATAGCAPATPPAAGRFSAPQATRSSAPQFDGGLTFAGGSKLTAATLPQIVETLAADQKWKLTTPDDGNGNWGYTGVDGRCVIHFTQQMLVDGVAVIPGDDRATTDNYLDYVFASEGKRVAAGASDSTVPFGLEEQGATAQARVLTGTGDDGTQWATYVRAFAGPGVGVVVDISCTPGADVTSTIHDVLADVTISLS